MPTRRDAGMLTPEEMGRLGEAKDTAFERLSSSS
jgi:hypothetical protein